MDNSCWGDRRRAEVKLPGGVAMTLHCQGARNHYASTYTNDGHPHYMTLRLNEARIDFEWSEEVGEVTDKPGMFDSKKSAALALGPLLVLSAILWAGIIALVWSVLQ